VKREARALAEGLGDQRRLGSVLGHHAHLYSLLGEHARAIGAADGARAIAEAVGDLGLRVVANYYLGTALSTTVSQKSLAHGGLVTAGEARGVRKEGPPVESIQSRDGGGDMAFRPHRKRPAA